MLAKYENGNYSVSIDDDGTKIRSCKENTFNPEFPESIDLKITDQCELNCPPCHESSCVDGEHGDIFSPFINTLHPGQEVAIGGGNPLAHPYLIPLLLNLSSLGIIANLTIHQYHFVHNISFVRNLVNAKLLHGLGISLSSPTPDFIEKVKEFPNAVIHTIDGVHTFHMLEPLLDKNLKILILGYKAKGRGKDLYVDLFESIQHNQKSIKDNMVKILNSFTTVSFDNLTIEQIGMRSYLLEDEWKKFYMGDDGKFTFYIDLVKQEFALSSTSLKRHPIGELTIKEMFDKIRSGI
jgi:hypothetical protein